MLAPSRLKTPVLVPVRHLIRRRSLTTLTKSNGQRREGLVDGDGVRREQLQETIEGMYGRASIGQELPRAALRAVPSKMQSAPAPPSPGLPTTSRTSPTTPIAESTFWTNFTLPVQSTPSAPSIPAQGVRVDLGSLSGQNQDKPNVDDARVEAQALPGVNQDTSNMGELPEPAKPNESSAVPAVTVNRPLPGQNQANPIKGELAPPPPALPPLSSQPSSTPLVNGPTSTPTMLSEPTTSLVPSTTPSSSTISPQTTSAVSSSAFTPPPVMSFVTITRSEEAKGESSAATTSSSTTSASAPSSSVSTTENTNALATVVAQSLTGVFTSTTAIASATSIPTALSSNQQDKSTLNPTARTLLIVFVILGNFLSTAPSLPWLTVDKAHCPSWSPQ